MKGICAYGLTRGHRAGEKTETQGVRFANAW